MKIYLDSIGCRLNQSEIERYSAHFRMAGHSLVSTPGESDLVVINTCTVTSKAAADSRSKVRRINRSNPRSSIVLTGCWSSLEESDALKLSGVSQIIPNEHKDDLVPLVLNLPPEIFDEEPVARQPIPGLRMRTRAFIKAQDGCDNQCTFCLTTIARGPSRSVHPDRVINEINAAVKGGVQEAVLTGVQLTSYGKDLLDPLDLKNLVERVFEDTELPRLRLSSLEPWNLPDEFLRLWENPRLCRQLHLPLQSGSASILRRMVRPITPQRYTKIIEEVRDLVPDIALTTDIISGFPGETQAEFEESLDFIRSMEFAYGHTFTYSPRPGTAALRLPQPEAPSGAARPSEDARGGSSDSGGGPAAGRRRERMGIPSRQTERVQLAEGKTKGSGEADREGETAGRSRPGRRSLGHRRPGVDGPLGVPELPVPFGEGCLRHLPED